MTPWGLALSFLLFAIVLFVTASLFPKARTLLLISGFLFLLIGTYSAYALWLPQMRGGVPPEGKAPGRPPVESMSTEQLAEWGAIIIFGNSETLSGQGKGQCTLCHAFEPGVVSERAPNLSGIVKRAAERIKEPRYLHPDTVAPEAYPGSGRATTADEYIAESHICPSCYVVAGHGIKGSRDRESPMPIMHRPPIALTLEEEIAVHTWLYVHDGEIPPSPQQIRADHEKFLPVDERLHSSPGHPARADARAMTVFASDSPEQIILKMGCSNCHQIPGIPWNTGLMGPILIEKVLAPKRLASVEYQARVRAGKARAHTPKEYVMESIVSPDHFIVPDFIYNGNSERSMMYPHYAESLTYSTLEILVDHLLTLDCDAARKEGLVGPPPETVSKICGSS